LGAAQIVLLNPNQPNSKLTRSEQEIARAQIGDIHVQKRDRVATAKVDQSIAILLFTVGLV
jgi:hypothetical protein